MEANGASSKRDFSNKISFCKKEAQGTKHWLRMISGDQPTATETARKPWLDAQELTMIFQKILNSSREPSRH